MTPTFTENFIFEELSLGLIKQIRDRVEDLENFVTDGTSFDSYA